MATYNSDIIDAGRPAITLPNQDITVSFSVSLTTALVDDDIVALAKLPKFAELLDFFIQTDGDLDTGTALEFDFGDDEDRDRYVATGSGFGQASGGDTLSTVDAIKGVLPFHNVDTGAGNQTDDVTVQLQVETAPTTGTTDVTLKGYIRYRMDKQYQETASA